MIKFKVRDKRNKGWFYLDNDYLNGYARTFGAVGTAIYVSLCRHANNEQKAYPSQRLIAEELNIGERTVRNYLKKFEAHNLIAKEKERDKNGRWFNNLYYLLDKSEWRVSQRQLVPLDNQRQITTEPEANNDRNQRQLVPLKNTNKKNTNKKNTNKKNTNSSAQSAEFEKLVADIIFSFKEVNPSYKVLFSRKPQREAVKRLLNEHGEERVRKIIAYLPKSNGTKFAPTITTPVQLETKLGELIAFTQKQKSETNRVVMAI